MKHTTYLTLSTAAAVVVLTATVIYAWETSPISKEKSTEPIVLKMPETFKECVNRIAYDAFVEADVGDTFDAGFDAGLFAATRCNKKLLK